MCAAACVCVTQARSQECVLSGYISSGEKMNYKCQKYARCMNTNKCSGYSTKTDTDE